MESVITYLPPAIVIAVAAWLGINTILKTGHESFRILRGNRATDRILDQVIKCFEVLEKSDDYNYSDLENAVRTHLDNNLLPRLESAIRRSQFFKEGKHWMPLFISARIALYITFLLVVFYFMSQHVDSIFDFFIDTFGDAFEGVSSWWFGAFLTFVLLGSLAGIFYVIVHLIDFLMDPIEERVVRRYMRKRNVSEE